MRFRDQQVGNSVGDLGLGRDARMQAAAGRAIPAARALSSQASPARSPSPCAWPWFTTAGPVVEPVEGDLYLTAIAGDWIARCPIQP